MITHTCSSSMTFTSSWLYDWGSWQRFCRISTSSPLGISSKWSSTKRFRKALDRTCSMYIGTTLSTEDSNSSSSSQTVSAYSKQIQRRKHKNMITVGLTTAWEHILATCTYQCYQYHCNDTLWCYLKLSYYYWWWFCRAVTAVGTSTKLLYVGTG